MRSIPLRIQGTPDNDDEVSRVPAPLALGFRPFFLGAGLFATLAVTGWVAVLFVGARPSPVASSLWHAHEMVFGFTMAVVAGFLLTAARNWTGLDTAHGYPLLALFALWLAGRFVMLGDWMPPVGVLIVNVTFPLLLSGVIARVIIKARRKRNYGIIAVLLAMAAASLAFHLDVWGWVEGLARPAIHGAVHFIVLLTVVIGGRIIPLFTRNKTDDATIRNIRAVDLAAVGATALVALLVAADAAGAVPQTALGIGAMVAGGLNLIRLRTWGTPRALRIPMLAVLHVGYVWIGVGQLLLGTAVLTSALPPNLALHALTIGAIGTLTIGMMSRVTLGHTGREITASRVLCVAFVLVSGSTLVRLSAAVVEPQALRWTWLGSGALFAAGFTIFGVWAFPYLTRARPDGRPG